MTARLHIQAALLALALFGLMLLSNFTALDFSVSHWFYSGPITKFIHKDEAFYAHVLHDGLRQAAVLAWLGLLVWSLKTSFITRPQSQTQQLANDYRWFLVLAGLGSAVLTSVLKQRSLHSCPWDLSEFGGRALYFHVFQALPGLDLNKLGPGHCFPSGHASVGWMWLGLCFPHFARTHSAGYDQQPTLRRRMAAAVAVFGVVVSGVQVIRGAHFVSHTLGTALACWLTCWVTYTLMARRATKRQGF